MRGRRGRARRRSGLRVRLTRLFALVAVLAVGFTSWLTFTAGFQVIGRLLAVERAGATVTATPPQDWRDFWRGLTPEERAAYAQNGRDAGRALGRAAILSALLSALLAVSVAAVATRTLTRPLGRLAEGARRLERGERGWRLLVPRRDDELRDLTVSFNAFMDSLERQEAWRRSLVADVAHDLRTPLAVLRAEIEAMQDGLNTPDAAGLARLHGEVMLLSRLVDDLRTLSLAEGGALSLHPERLDAGTVVHEAVEAVRARASGAGFTLRLDVPATGLSLVADRTRLAQVLYQLLDNAVRHARPGEITVRLWGEAGQVCVQVQDQGPGLSDEALSRAFERFYRADAARSRGGSGLGLAIVRALVEAMGGEVRAENQPGGGAAFTLRFPAA